MKVCVSLNKENNVLLMVPLTKAVGVVEENKIMIARLLTQEEYDREAKEAMQDGCRTYKRVNRRTRETR